MSAHSQQQQQQPVRSPSNTRTPLSVKNVQPRSQVRNNGAGPTTLGVVDHAFKQQQQHQQQPAITHRDAPRVEGGTRASPSATRHQKAPTASAGPSDGRTQPQSQPRQQLQQPHPARTTQHTPYREQQHNIIPSTPLDADTRLSPHIAHPAQVRTPKKRAIPTDDTHARNLVDIDAADEQRTDGSPPYKRTRSSNDNDAPLPSTTGKTKAISLAVGKMQVDSPAADHARSRLPKSASASASGSAAMTAATTPTPTASASASASAPRQPRQRAPSVTTTRIDKYSRLSAAERAQREEIKRLQTEAWRKRYSAAFVKFKFYLDGFDDQKKALLLGVIHQLGGSSEPFFSKMCTHVVTSRKAVPDPRSAAKAKAAGIARKTETKRFSPSKKGITRKNRELPLHSDRNPFEDPVVTAPTVPSNDILCKAQEMGVRVWVQDKFWTTVNSIAGYDLSAGTSASSKQGLAQLLQHEKIHGTSERDLTVPQESTRYFDKNAIYVYIEDATAEHRPIMLHEFEPPAEGADPPWPKLYGEVENRCPFTRYDLAPRTLPRVDGGATHQRSLLRTASQNNIKRQYPPTEAYMLRDGLDGAPSPHQMASGNSISVASMASTMASNVTSAIGTAGSHASFNGNLAFLSAQDKRVAHLSRRAVSAAAAVATPENSPNAERNLSGAALAPHDGGGSNRPSPTPSNASERSALVRSLLGMTQGEQEGQAASRGARRALNATPNTQTHRPAVPSFNAAFNDVMPQRSKSHGMQLQQSQTQTPAFNQTTKGNDFAQTRTHVKEQLPTGTTTAKKAEAKDEAKKAWCENCRQHYDELEEHCASSRHRRFATDDSHFTALDMLIADCQRPYAPWVHTSARKQSAKTHWVDDVESDEEADTGSDFVRSDEESEEELDSQYDDEGAEDGCDEYEEGEEEGDDDDGKDDDEEDECFGDEAEAAGDDSREAFSLGGQTDHLTEVSGPTSRDAVEVVDPIFVQDGLQDKEDVPPRGSVAAHHHHHHHDGGHHGAGQSFEWENHSIEEGNTSYEYNTSLGDNDDVGEGDITVTPHTSPEPHAAEFEGATTRKVLPAESARQTYEDLEDELFNMG